MLFLLKLYVMNKFLGFCALALFFTSCDDGDLIFEDINFNEVTASKCDNKIYKLNDSEALILKIGNSETDLSFISAFPSQPTTQNEPTVIQINNTSNKVVYRLYDGEVALENICGSIPAAFPIILEEWEATSGSIEITTTAVLAENTEDGFEGGQKITGYQNNVVFRNITFKKADGTTQVYDEFPFGIYLKNITTVLPFNFGDITLQNCPASDIVFKTIGNEAFTLNLDPALKDSSALGVVKTGLVTSTTNAVNYYFNFPTGTIINGDLLCPATLFVVPQQQWTGVDGEQNFSGIVEVVSSALPSSAGFSYEIRIKNLTLKQNRNEFLLATDYLFGTLIETN